MCRLLIALRCEGLTVTCSKLTKQVDEVRSEKKNRVTFIITEEIRVWKMVSVSLFDPLLTFLIENNFLTVLSWRPSNLWGSGGSY